MSFFKKIFILTVLMLLCSSLISLSSFANDEPILEDVLATEKVEGYSTNVDLNEYVVSKEFDLEEEVANMPSIDKMTKEEKDLFDSIVEEQVALAGLESEEEERLFAKAMDDFFDDNSETYNDLSLAQTELMEQVEDISTTTYENDDLEVSSRVFFDKTFTIERAHAVQVKVGVKFAGAVFNGAIGFAIGGGVRAIQAFIIKKGKKEAQKIFTRTVVSRLKAWGAPKLALATGACVTVALNYLDVGTEIAKQLDKRDKRPNNGWIDFY